MWFIIIIIIIIIILIYFLFFLYIYSVKPVLSSQPVLCGHLTIPYGWLHNKGSTTLSIFL